MRSNAVGEGGGGVLGLAWDVAVMMPLQYYNLLKTFERLFSIFKDFLSIMQKWFQLYTLFFFLIF
jgi:hypothetical protein